jgi:hypothetical protein
MKKLARILDLSQIQNKRWIIIGDIHGSFDQLINLLNKCNYNKNKDIIVATGDLVDRADQSYEVLNFFMPDNSHEEHNIYTVCGNHDDKFRRWCIGNKVTIGKALQKTIDEITLKSLNLKIDKVKFALFIDALPHIIRLPDLNNLPCYVVHAGIDTRYPIDSQTKDTCIYIRGIDSKNYFDESSGLWLDSLCGGYIIIHGHIGTKIVNPNKWCYSLDGGCASGGVLRAMIIEYEKI